MARNPSAAKRQEVLHRGEIECLESKNRHPGTRNDCGKSDRKGSTESTTNQAGHSAGGHIS